MIIFIGVWLLPCWCPLSGIEAERCVVKFWFLCAEGRCFHTSTWHWSTCFFLYAYVTKKEVSFLFKFFAFVAFFSGRIKCSKKCRVVRLCRRFIPWQQVGTIPLSETCFYLSFSFFFSFPFFQLGRETSGSPNNGSVANLLGSSSSGSLFLDVRWRQSASRLRVVLLQNRFLPANNKKLCRKRRDPSAQRTARSTAEFFRCRAINYGQRYFVICLVLALGETPTHRWLLRFPRHCWHFYSNYRLIIFSYLLILLSSLLDRWVFTYSCRLLKIQINPISSITCLILLKEMYLWLFWECQWHSSLKPRCISLFFLVVRVKAS
jgi:hypothetical protein